MLEIHVLLWYMNQLCQEVTVASFTDHEKDLERIVRVLGPTVYCIQDCTCPRRKEVIHFTYLKSLVGMGMLQHAVPNTHPPSVTTSSATPNCDPCNIYDSD